MIIQRIKNGPSLIINGWSLHDFDWHLMWNAIPSKSKYIHVRKNTHEPIKEKHPFLYSILNRQEVIF